MQVTTPKGDEFDDFLNIRVVQLAAKLQLIAQRRVLRPAGIPILNWRLMLILYRAGASNLVELIKPSSTDPAHASRAIAQMVAEGLIERRSDPSDNRRRLLSLTDAGIAVVKKYWPQMKSANDEIQSAFNTEEFQGLKHLLDRARSKADEMQSDDEKQLNNRTTNAA